MDFAEYLRKSEGSENSEVYYGRFLRNGLHESIVRLAKVDEMYKILKVGLPIVFGREMELYDQSFAGVCFSMSIRLLRSCFIEEQASSSCHDFL